MAFENIVNQIKSALKDEVTERFGQALGDLGITRRVAKNSSISDFQASLSRSNGMARGNRYEVEITAPGNHPGGSINRTINLHCNTISMPGHNLEQQTQRFGSEPATEIVTSHTFAGNILATFYLDASLETKSWFDKWQELAIDPITHKARYYDDYKDGSMKIFQLNNNQRTYGVKCEEVYPATISPIEYGYESTDTIALLSVEFAYRKWQEVDNLEAGTTIRRETYLGEVSEEVGIQNAKKPYMFDKSRIFK
jgi:hypothetical protein|tara:strand:- start:46 stop:804 length:759 start_codon:yes stop_codon:yes gene_type:complete